MKIFKKLETWLKLDNFKAKLLLIATEYLIFFKVELDLNRISEIGNTQTWLSFNLYISKSSNLTR